MSTSRSMSRSLGATSGTGIASSRLAYSDFSPECCGTTGSRSGLAILSLGYDPITFSKRMYLSVKYLFATRMMSSRVMERMASTWARYSSQLRPWLITETIWSERPEMVSSISSALRAASNFSASTSRSENSPLLTFSICSQQSFSALGSEPKGMLGTTAKPTMPISLNRGSLWAPPSSILCPRVSESSRPEPKPLVSRPVARSSAGASSSLSVGPLKAYTAILTRGISALIFTLRMPVKGSTSTGAFSGVSPRRMRPKVRSSSGSSPSSSKSPLRTRPMLHPT